jgi:outer membrane lipoprotein-sorting protein
MSKVLLLFVFAGFMLGSDDPTQVLKTTVEAYQGLKSYVFEGSTVSETRLGGTDSKSETGFVVAFKEPNLFRVEYTYPSAGNWIRVSDGTTLWRHRSLTKELKQEPASDDALRILTGSPVASFERLGDGISHPELLASESIPIGGQNLDCYVVQVERPATGIRSGGKPAQVKLWIDKSRHVVLRQVTRSDSGPTENTETITFTRADVNQPVPEALFHFNPSDKK